MRDNTRLDQALPQYTGIHQFMPPTAQTEPKVLPKNVQPEPGTASAWANPAPVPLPHSADDLFNQWIEYPDEDIPQPEVSTLVANNLDHYPTTHHDDNFHTNQEITSENASSPPPSIANQSNSDFDAFLTSLGLVVDPDYLKLCRDPDPEEIPKDYIKHFELKGTSDIGHVAGDCVRLQEEKEVTSADIVILPNSKPEFPSMGLQQPFVTSPSQPTTNPAHISTQASLSSTTPTRTTTIIRSQTTATTYPQSSEIGMLPHSATVASGGCTENPSPGSVVNFINSSNNTLYMYYQTPSHPASRQSQPTPQVQDQTASPITSTRSTTVQHHSSALAGASTSVRSRDEASKPEVPPNSTFNPTPLKQSWTSDNVNVKEERKASVVTSQSSQVHTEVQSCIPAQPSSQVGSSPQSQALAFSSAPVVRQLSSLHPFYAEPLTPSQYTLTDAAQPGTLGRLQARALSRPRALELANPKSPLHEEPINTAVTVQRALSCRQLRFNTDSRPAAPPQLAPILTQPHGALQAGSASSHGSTPAPAQSNIQVTEASKTSPPQQIGSYTPTQAPPPAVPSALDRPVASTQPRGASVASACFYPSAQTLMRPPANSNFHTRTLPITPGSSWNETYAAAPLQAAAGLHRPPQDQTFTQAQSHTQETSTQLTRPVGVCGQGMIKTWIVKGKNEGEWYNVETGYYDEPIRVYPASEPTALLHQLNNHWRYGNSMPRPATQVLTQQQNDIQVSSEEIYQAPQQVHNPDPQLLNDQSQANMQRYTRQTSPWPVQRSYSASSLPVQAPGAPFTVAAPPPTAFKPRFGDDTFSHSYWRHVPSDPNFFSQSANPRAYVPPVTHRHSPYIHASTAGPPTQAPVPRPSTSAHVNGQLATHSSSQSSSSLSSLSRPTSSCTPDSAAPGPKDKGKKRRATADIEDDDEIQEIPAIEYRASNSKGKRVKHRPN